MKLTARQKQDLRDQFAGLAMQAKLILCGVPAYTETILTQAEALGMTADAYIALGAYEMADAMLKARHKA